MAARPATDPGALGRPYAVGIALAAVLVVSYLVALAGWPEDQARAFGFAVLLASRPVLLLGMRSPHRPLWGSGRPWTRTLRAVIAVVVGVTVAVVYIEPVADLLHLDPFPAVWWLAVAGLAATTAWSEPFKRSPGTYLPPRPSTD